MTSSETWTKPVSTRIWRKAVIMHNGPSSALRETFSIELIRIDEVFFPDHRHSGLCSHKYFQDSNDYIWKQELPANWSANWFRFPFRDQMLPSNSHPKSSTRNIRIGGRPEVTPLPMLQRPTDMFSDATDTMKQMKAPEDQSLGTSK